MGKESSIKGKACIVQNTGNAKLKLQFFWPFRGKYWIINLAEDYCYAVVDRPIRQNLRILSRTPQMSENASQQIVAGIPENGFDVSLL